MNMNFIGKISFLLLIVVGVSALMWFCVAGHAFFGSMLGFESPCTISDDSNIDTCL